MPDTALKISEAVQTRLAKTLFNLAWDYLLRDDRSPDDDELMLHAAHASCFFWRQVGQPVHWARGQWQLARVNAVLERPEAALHHARRCLTICREERLGPFDQACAHEALARTGLVAGDLTQARKALAAGFAAAGQIQNAEEKQLALDDLRDLAARLQA